MKIDIIQVPWDSGHRAVRMGAGPVRLVEGGLPGQLAARGHDVRVVPVEVASALPLEVAATFELAASIRAQVAAALRRGALPLVLSGNCSATLGALAALSEPDLFWFDGHGDLNTPETTLSGFLDGMALSIALGRCWTRLAAHAGVTPVPEEHVWLLGARDLDPAEAGFVIRSALHTTLDDLTRSDRPAYVHIDLDVLDPTVATANGFAAPGGYSLGQLLGAIRLVGRSRRVVAATLSAYDPAADPAGAVVQAAFAIGERLAAVAAR